MLAEFVQELLKLKRPETVEVHGRPYATGTLQPIATPMAASGGSGRWTQLRRGSRIRV